MSEPRTALDLSPLLGTWMNTNASSRGVARLHITKAADARLAVTAHAGESWGPAMAHPYSVDGFEGRHALAFNTTFDLGAMDVRLQANIKAGVLVIVFLTRFHDDRANLFIREFYYRTRESGVGGRESEKA
ncbi:MAG TPA: hypothetical protein VNN08_22145 [Thermoanaerobaculia bacterium]|nr:hypothetical protein [Thermoanaerobaculia bacterium]